MESILLHYTRALGSYKKDPRVQNLSHTLGAEIAVHILRVGLNCSLILSKVDFNRMRMIPSSQSEWTNEMNCVPRLQQDLIDYKEHLSKSGYKITLPLDQKSVDLQQDIICQFTSLEIQFWMRAVKQLKLVEHTSRCHSIDALWDVRGIGTALLGSAVVN